MNSGADLRDASWRNVVTRGLPWTLVLAVALAIRLCRYVCGPDWPPCRQPGRREMLSVHGDVPTLLQAWDRGHDAWLVLGAGPRSDALRSWSSTLPSKPFPTAEGDAMVRQLPAEVAAK